MTENPPTKDRTSDETATDEGPRDSGETVPTNSRADGGTAEGRPKVATAGEAAETTTSEHEADTTTSEHEAETAGDETGSPDAAEGYGSEAEKARRYLLKGALGMLALLGFIATIQFYRSASSAITQLVSPEFQPAFAAAFNLVVLLAVGIAIVQVLRRLQ